MKRLRLSPIVICLLLAAGIAYWWKSTQSQRHLATEVYVWQRADSPELRAALDRSRDTITKRHFLAVEIGKHNSKWRVTRSTFPDELITRNGLVMRIGASLAGESWREGEALDRVLAEAAWMAARPATEFQIDYDCPQRSLGDYQRLLEKIKVRHPGRKWSITALPSWLNETSAKRLFKTADGVVLQVHSLQLPDQPQRPVILCDPAATREAVRKMSKLDVPFRVALNTYGCEVLFDENNRVLDVVSEDTGNSPHRNATRRSVGISDAVELAGLVAGWKSHPPRGLSGIVWYRLPLDLDRRNWRWGTLQRVASGVTPVSDLRIEARTAANGAWDLVLANRGERDERLPEIVSTGCETLVLEGANGYGSDADDRLILENTAWPWLPPGDSLTIGWLRPAQASARPAPEIPTPP
jgi:hypothetical protein